MGERLGAEASPRLAAIGALTTSLKFRGEARGTRLCLRGGCLTVNILHYYSYFKQEINHGMNLMLRSLSSPLRGPAMSPFPRPDVIAFQTRKSNCSHR